MLELIWEKVIPEFALAFPGTLSVSSFYYCRCTHEARPQQFKIDWHVMVANGATCKGNASLSEFWEMDAFSLHASALRLPQVLHVICFRRFILVRVHARLYLISPRHMIWLISLSWWYYAWLLLKVLMSLAAGGLWGFIGDILYDGSISGGTFEIPHFQNID